ncbi:hypothetical protein, partial [Comamonas piscis]
LLAKQASKQASKQQDKAKSHSNEKTRQHGFPTNPKIPTFQRAEAATKAATALPKPQQAKTRVSF